MSEDLLYYIWQKKLFNTADLKTTGGEPISIAHSGIRNDDSGPDFTHSKIRINGDLLAGNVEIHVKSSDWEKHRHHHDKAYSNVILHVVYQDDAKHLSPALPTLELIDKIDERFINRYRLLMDSAAWIPCESHIKQIDEFTISSGLHRMLIERLEQKTSAILERLAKNKNSWEETFYQLTARNFGLKANADTFEALAKSLPLKIIAKHKNSLPQIEALLFGQAGMLDAAFNDEYPNALKKEYQFLRQKYNLNPLQVHLWKFMRLRPASFPTVRIAQFAMLLYQATHLFSKMLEAENIKRLSLLFQPTPSDYWLTRYRFDIPSISKKKPLGDDFINTLIINAAIPVMFVYGKSHDNIVMQDKVLGFLEQLPSEKNKIISGWKNMGVSSRSAYDSQALLQLKNMYCDLKKCLHCHIGSKILR